jgi:hypothetical protein
MRRYFGHLLHRDEHGRVHATSSDREPFLLNVIDVSGRSAEKVVRGSVVRQRNLAHHRALAHFAGPDGGDPAILAPFVGKRVAGVELLTDPDTIEQLFDAGELDFLEYQSF